jgi:sulfite exporter TauE/SafE
MANGFLPCPMTYAFVAASASTGSPLWGAATMLVLALTSALPLTAISIAGGKLAPLAGRRIHWVSGGLMLVLAAMLLRKGILGGMHHGH